MVGQPVLAHMVLTSLLGILGLVTIPEAPVWYTQLGQGLAEARRTGRPLLLLSAAPQCAEVPGDW